jgi:hypothetical protein
VVTAATETERLRRWLRVSLLNQKVGIGLDLDLDWVLGIGYRLGAIGHWELVGSR